VVLAALVPLRAGARASYIVGTEPFTEQSVLGALIGQRLAAAGLPASRRDGLGSAVIFGALVAGDIDVYVSYSGTIWATRMHRSDVKPREEVLTAVGDWLKQTHGVRMLGSLGFEDAYALAMPRKKADALGIASIADLAAHAPQLSIAGDYEFFERPEWKALRAAYGLAFASQRTMQPDFMYQAAAAGEVDVVSAYTSDGRIAKYDLKVLSDPKQAIPPYDAIVLLAPKRANDDKLAAALQPLIGAVDVEIMREANLRASGGDVLPDEVAKWLWGKIGKR
jgi:osmoprotectant transport system permease protein